uniref:Melanoregulin n=1 Tax=Coturnix japonica TaxID=93934 RepID=A0A8C2TV71_COTJA
MSPLCSNNNPYASFGATLARDEEQNLWSTPHDVTHTEADDDRVLYNMIVGRSQLDKDSEEWQKLNYDIYTLRQTRKEVRSRWKHILEDLGFQKEADSLLSVTKLSIVSDSQNMSKARDILLKLSEETNIFPTSWELSERYLFVVVSSSSRASLLLALALQVCSGAGSRQMTHARGCSMMWWQ